MKLLWFCISLNSRNNLTKCHLCIPFTQQNNKCLKLSSKIVVSHEINFLVIRNCCFRDKALRMNSRLFKIRK